MSLGERTFDLTLLGTIRSGAREVAKSIAFSVLGHDPLLRRRLERIRRSGATTILNLHRVGADDGSGYRPLSPGLFDELLAFAKREFAVVTFGELGERSAKPKLIISFDDGYKDFMTDAVPILKRHGIGRTRTSSRLACEFGLPAAQCRRPGFRWQGASRAEPQAGDSRLCGAEGCAVRGSAVDVPEDEAGGQAGAACRGLLPQFAEWDAFSPTKMMTLDEVARLPAEHELGAHSYSHSSMAFESDAFLDADVRRCADYFSAKLQRPMTIYAFPNGSCREGQVSVSRPWQLSMSCGGELAVGPHPSSLYVRRPLAGACPGESDRGHGQAGESDCRFRRCLHAARTRPQIGRDCPARPYRQNTIAAGGTAPMDPHAVSVTLARGLRRAWRQSLPLL